eukprot:767569-Hanusia_phi.AAC.4
MWICSSHQRMLFLSSVALSLRLNSPIPSIAPTSLPSLKEILNDFKEIPLPQSSVSRRGGAVAGGEEGRTRGGAGREEETRGRRRGGEEGQEAFAYDDAAFHHLYSTEISSYRQQQRR